MTPIEGRKPACVVLDIDGVLADVRHRLHYVASRPKNWAAFFAAAGKDPVLKVGAEFARAASSSHLVVYLTGRPERLRTVTERWLRHHDLPAGRLLMRSDGDHRPAVLVKTEHLQALQNESRIDLVVDDDPLVAAAAELAGFATKLADWMPRGAPALHDAQERDGRT